MVFMRGVKLSSIICNRWHQNRKRGSTPPPSEDSRPKRGAAAAPPPGPDERPNSGLSGDGRSKGKDRLLKPEPPSSQGRDSIQSRKLAQKLFPKVSRTLLSPIF